LDTVNYINSFPAPISFSIYTGLQNTIFFVLILAAQMWVSHNSRPTGVFATVKLQTKGMMMGPPVEKQFSQRPK